MNHDITIKPENTDTPHARMGGTEKNIPVLYLDGEYGSVRLQFRAGSPVATTAYLDSLIEEATRLRSKIADSLLVAP